MLRDNAFGEYIKSKRIEKNLTLRQASNEIGISHTHLSTLEKGVDPRTGTRVKAKPEIIQLISDAYRVDYYYLLSLVGYITNPKSVEITDEENNDLEFEVKKLLYDLNKRSFMTLSGKPVDESDFDYFRETIEVAIEMAKVRMKKSKMGK